MRWHVTHIICNVQDYSGLYNKVVHHVICEGILLILYVMLKIIYVFIITWFTLLYVRDFTHIICNVQHYIGLYNNVAHTVICEGILLILYVMFKIIAFFIIT
jgi:hypothetical protein